MRQKTLSRHGATHFTFLVRVQSGNKSSMRHYVNVRCKPTVSVQRDLLVGYRNKTNPEKSSHYIELLSNLDNLHGRFMDSQGFTMISMKLSII